MEELILEEEETIYSVDIPDLYGDAYICVRDDFKTKEEAIEFAMDRFGADEFGMVCLISTF